MNAKDFFGWAFGALFAGVAAFVWLGFICLLHDLFVKGGKDD